MPTNTTISSTKKATDGIVVRENLPVKNHRHSYKVLENELVARLEHLRAEVREICDAYLENVEAEITTLTDFLEGSSEVRAPEARKARTMKRWLAVLDRTDLKPRKGRRKDLKRVDKALRKLMNSAFE